MASFFLSNEEYDCLSKIFAGDQQISQEERELLSRSQLIDERENGEKGINDSTLFWLEACMNCDASMSVVRKDAAGTIEYSYYLKRDYIVRAEKRIDGYQYLSLPSIKYAIGSVADMIWDDTGDTEKEQYESFLNDELNAENYVELLNTVIEESKYRISEKEMVTEFLISGMNSDQAIDVFMAVRCQDGIAKYYKQEFGKIIYGTGSRAELTNQICHWMLYKHRELISKILEEK